jgi:hypothetical protein
VREGIDMPEPYPVSPRVSWRRVSLLVTFGILAGMALTRPGQWVAWYVFAPLRADASTDLPLYLEMVFGPASRQLEATRLLADMCNAGDPAAGSHPVPSPEQVAARLAHLDGWTRAIQFELCSEMDDLNEAGVKDRMLCARIASTYLRRPSDRAFFSTFAVRTWILLLLDGQDRAVAAVNVTAVRPGWKLADSPEQRYYVADPSAPGDGDLPAISLFHRTATGEVLRD